jgi:hypothetical protein
MKVFSIDVGIKNLSFCLLDIDSTNSEKKKQIVLWDNIDLCQQTSNNCTYSDNNTNCFKPAKWQNLNHCLCLKHAKLYHYLFPTSASDLTVSFLNKQPLQILKNIANKYKIIYPTTLAKPALLQLLKDFSLQKCYIPIKKTNATKIDLITIGKNIQFKLNDILQPFQNNIQHIIIENQIGPIANKMKTIQGMIAQYFIMTIPNINIEFISAINKLKDYNEFINLTKETNKLDYKQRKLVSINICKNLINENQDFNKWQSFFSNYKKKDDLSDCLLQGLWYINHKII